MNSNRAIGRQRICAAPAKFVLGALGALSVCALDACSLHWPWSHPVTAGPAAVQEVVVETPDTGVDAGAGTGNRVATSQYWDRNTLLIDLGQVAGEGSLKIRPVAGHDWPIRLEFRVRPGRIGSLEVRGAQRMTFAVPAQGADAVLALPPGVYAPQTKSIDVRWSAAASTP